jgi:mannosyltransferase
MRKHLWLIGVLMVALSVRLVLINQSFWLDEAAQALESARPLGQQLQISADFQPPLFHLIVHFWMAFGSSEAWLRMSSVFAGLVTIIATYFIAQRLWSGKVGARIGLLAALFLSLSELHVYYSQELRPYAIAAMFAAVSWLALLSYFKNKQSKWLVLFTLFTIGGVYSMYLYPFLVIAQVVYVLIWQRNTFRQLMISLTLNIVAFLPWLPSFLVQLHVGTSLQQSLPGWSQVVSTPQLKALPLVWLKFLGGMLPVDLNIGTIFFFAIPTAIALWMGMQIFRQSKSRGGSKPLLIWFALPIVLAWLVSFVIPVLSFKRVLFSLPPLYLLIAAGIVTLKNSRLRALIVCCFVACELLSLAAYWSYPQNQRERWRETHDQLVSSFSAENTLVIFAFDAPFAPWRWYDRDQTLKLATLSFSHVPLSDPTFSQTMQKSLLYKHVLVFDYLRDLTDPSRMIDAWLLSHGFTAGQILDTQNMGFVREYDQQRFYSMR